MNHDFEDIEVKANAIELLEDALKRKRKRSMLATGAMSDPYMPLENNLRYLRQALMLAYQYGFGFTILTKSAGVLRDLDLLQAINEQTKCIVQMTLTTYDERLCRKLEPHVSTTKERVEALARLHEAHIPTIVWLCPILPFINDTTENIAGLLKYCQEAGVYGVLCFGMGLTLREGNREYFYTQLDKSFPGLKIRYIRNYGNRYQINSPHNDSLMRYFHETCPKKGLVHDNKALFDYLYTFEDKRQLCLFD